MLSKSEIKFLKSLSVKKYRNRHRQYLIEGYRLVRECLNADYPVEKLWLSTEFQASPHGTEIIGELSRRNLAWETACAESLSKVTDTLHSQGIAALLPMSLYTSEPVAGGNLLILDSISDPGNLGTLLRTAEWFGLETVVLSPNSVDPFSPKVVRSAMGAHFYLSIYEKRLAEFLSELRGRNFQLIGGVMQGVPLETLCAGSDADWALVLGNEAHGLSPVLEGLLTTKVTVPRKGHVESLNLAAAGAILLNHLTEKTGK